MLSERCLKSRLLDLLSERLGCLDRDLVDERRVDRLEEELLCERCLERIDKARLGEKLRDEVRPVTQSYKCTT